MIFEILGGVFICTGFWTFITEVYRNRKKKKTPMEEMILALTRDKLLFLSKKYIQANGVPEDEYESFFKIGTAYVNAGGNTKVKSLFEQAMKLPMIIEREGRND